MPDRGGREFERHAKEWKQRLSDRSSVFDAFAALFSVVSFCGLYRDIYDNSNKEIDRRVGGISQRLRSRMESHLDDESAFETIPDPVRSEVGRCLAALGQKGDDEDAIKTAIAWLLFFDSLFIGLGFVLKADDSVRVTIARDRLREHKRLNSADIPGAVLSKSTHGERGAGVFQLLTNLTYVDLLPDASLKYRLFEDAGGAMALGEFDQFHVGVIAAIQSHTELEWAFREDPPEYEVRLKQDSEELIIQRVLGALEKMSDKAHVVVIPELVCSENTTARIATWLRTTRDRGRHFPLLVLAGTYLAANGTARPHNLATVLAGDGTAVLCQHKLNEYTFKASHREGLSIPGARGLDYVEAIHRTPYELAVLDLNGLGRIVVMICEDASSPGPWRKALPCLGPHVCLLPIMNGPSDNGLWKWVQYHSENIAAEAGACVFAANSGTLLGPVGRKPADYQLFRGPKIAKDSYAKWNLTDSGDVDGDGLTDWWLHAGPSWPILFS